MLTLDPLPTAIFTVNNMTAVGAMQALRERELSVPADIGRSASVRTYFQQSGHAQPSHRASGRPYRARVLLHQHRRPRTQGLTAAIGAADLCSLQGWYWHLADKRLPTREVRFRS
jgi:hypothetical protein